MILTLFPGKDKDTDLNAVYNLFKFAVGLVCKIGLSVCVHFLSFFSLFAEYKRIIIPYKK